MQHLHLARSQQVVRVRDRPRHQRHYRRFQRLQVAAHQQRLLRHHLDIHQEDQRRGLAPTGLPPAPGSTWRMFALDTNDGSSEHVPSPFPISHKTASLPLRYPDSVFSRNCEPVRHRSTKYPVRTSATAHRAHDRSSHLSGQHGKRPWRFPGTSAAAPPAFMFLHPAPRSTRSRGG